MTAIATRPAEHLAFSLNGDAPPNPLQFVSGQVRKSLSYFWMCYSKLLPSILPIAALMATWQREGGISEEQINEILHGLTRPNRVAEFRFGSDLQCTLGALVAEQIRRNQARERMLARRAESPIATDGGFSIAAAAAKVIAGLEGTQ